MWFENRGQLAYYRRSRRVGARRVSIIILIVECDACGDDWGLYRVVGASLGKCVVVVEYKLRDRKSVVVER